MSAALKTINVLRNFYTKNGEPHVLNDVQLTIYTQTLDRFDEGQLEAAARHFITHSKFFPALSELLAILEPTASPEQQAHMAWAALESAVRRAGAYAGVTFMNGSVGQTARQVFGTWKAACSFDLDSPGWAIRRQTFLALFPTIAARDSGAPVTLHGSERGASPIVIGPIDGLPATAVLGEGDRELSPAESIAALADIRRRFDARSQPDQPPMTAKSFADKVRTRTRELTRPPQLEETR